MSKVKSRVKENDEKIVNYKWSGYEVEIAEIKVASEHVA